MLNETLIIPPPIEPLNPSQFGLPGVIVISAFTPAQELTGVEADEPVSVGPLGNPVYCDIQFKGATYIDRDGTTKTFAGITLQTILMVVDQQKKIVTTSIDGADGEVIEYIGNSNFQVQINGVIDGPNGVYPRAAVTALLGVCDVRRPIDVVCWYLQQFGIDKLVITDYAFPQIPGGYSSQQFSIAALSSKAIEAKIKEPA